MSLATLLEWWNFVFALPLAVGGVLLLGLALSGMIDLSSDQADSDAAMRTPTQATPTTAMLTHMPTTRGICTPTQATRTATTPRARMASTASSKRPTAATTTTPPPRNRSGSRC